MKTRNQSKRNTPSTGEDELSRESVHDTKVNGTLVNTSQDGVSKFLKQVGSRRSRGLKKQGNHPLSWDAADKSIIQLMEKEKQVKVNSCAQNILDVNGSKNSLPLNTNDGSRQQAKSELEDVMADSDWEDGSNPNLNSENNHQGYINKDITIEFDSSPGTAKRKPIRRASAEEKEVAELVHRAHLLCLIGRGRLIDSACDDPLIQASLLSLLPANLLKLLEATNVTADALTPLVNWLHCNFHVRISSSESSFQLALAKALENHEGTSEEVAALSVALFRAMNFSTRFVSILDAASLKPDADKCDDMPQGRKSGKGVFDSSTIMVTQSNEASTSSGKKTAPIGVDKKITSEASTKASSQRKSKRSGQSQTVSQDTDSPIVDQSNEKNMDPSSKGSKRKGDIEFEMQMEMALSATAAQTSECNLDNDVKGSNITSSSLSPFKRLKKIKFDESQDISTAVGSRKTGAPMYWAEVYCSGENSTGKWVHVDAVNAIVDGEDKVEAAAAACKTKLRYVVAFAGHGAKDVTRRYCAKWYMIASHRVNSTWWDSVLQPLKELESRASEGTSRAPNNVKKEERTYLEDMELETKALTEPLPTNQQAYKNHHLYALERWLTKYQILHPKGPILGFCSGHPVYPRACVQMLHTKERWMREGLQLKINELPAKVLKRSTKVNKGKVPEADEDDENDSAGPGGTVDLYGKWQTEPLCLPSAENGIVPKNDRGQVDVWSEKCLPPGTVHLGFPRIFVIAKKLEIDYAPAMVGFEFRNGRSIPVYNGIVVCSEFKNTILEAYAEEEMRRGAEERRKNEAQAISRWYQLLSSIITRQRLNNRYADGISSQPSNDIQETNDASHHTIEDIHKPISDQAKEDVGQPDVVQQPLFEEDHEHVFLTNDPGSDVESSIRTKRCRCGFSIEVEEL